MKRRRSRANPLSSLTDAVNTGIATWLTLAVRMPQLAAGTMRPAEMRRMVSEKVAAAAEGVVQGGVAAGKIARRRHMAVTPFDVATDMMTIAEAATSPARRRVKANARQLIEAVPLKRHRAP